MTTFSAPVGRLLRETVVALVALFQAGCTDLPRTEIPDASLPEIPDGSPPDAPDAAPDTPDSTPPDAPDGSAPPAAHCDAGDQAFVRRAMLELAGRRPWGQAEVDAVTDAIAEIRAMRGDPSDLTGPRRVVARALMEDSGFVTRWSDFFKDALRVARTQTKSLESCYGESPSGMPETTVLAAYVRDHDPSDREPPVPNFTLRELLASALELDDVSVVYRANLLAIMGRPFTGNSSGLELELARRNDFGTLFEATYTARDVSCLACHNSDSSITWDADPLRRRFWPVPGSFELALFGSSTGEHPEDEAATKGSNILRARGMFRVMDVAAGSSGHPPFGWDPAQCGTLAVPATDDPMGIDTYFGSVRSTPERPSLGLRASVWDLERSLHRGVDALAEHGLTRLPDGTLPEPDEAFAYLVAANIVDRVWTEIFGTSLTVAHHFPRTEVQRDALVELTDAFIRTHFSLKGLLLGIVTHPTFNLKSPEEGCGGGPYPLPRLFDPWTDAELDAEARANGPSDLVHAVSPRLLRWALHRALGWPAFPEYPSPDSEEEKTQLALGFFLRDAAPGQRGLDLQGRLVWEAEYGGCSNRGAADFVSTLVADATRTPGATLADAVRVLKDRLTGEPTLDSDETAALGTLLGAPLESTDFSAAEPGLRRVCGAFLATPQFLLQGLVPRDSRGAPRLTPPSASYDTACRTMNASLASIGAAERLDCEKAP